jgi:predicted nucleic acid-binding Zn ribbon protein
MKTIDDRNNTLNDVCPGCRSEGKLVKVWTDTNIGLVFKGTGFYKTDYASSGQPTSELTSKVPDP